VTKIPRSFVLQTRVPDARDEGRDRELLEDLASGRREALAELYDRHAASLFRHALAVARQQAEAEDLVHVVFVKLATTGAPLLGVRAPASYLHRMLNSAWVDAQRRTITAQRAVASGTTESFGPQPVPSGMDDAIDIGRALDALPAPQREVVVLHLVEGFSFREIGRMTGVSLFTAAARYRLAVGRLRNVLGRARRDTT
jgi:RNA polymerase sigma-70 factor (ECF subfamily)